MVKRRKNPVVTAEIKMQSASGRGRCVFCIAEYCRNTSYKREKIFQCLGLIFESYLWKQIFPQAALSDMHGIRLIFK